MTKTRTVEGAAFSPDTLHTFLVEYSIATGPVDLLFEGGPAVGEPEICVLAMTMSGPDAPTITVGMSLSMARRVADSIEDKLDDYPGGDPDKLWRLIDGLRRTVADLKAYDQ